MIDPEQVEEARFMREVLECAVVGQICGKLSDAELSELEENVLLQKFYLDNHLTDKLQMLDDQFHQSLFRIAGKSRIYVLMDSISIHFDRARRMSFAVVKDLKIVSDHAEILEAMKKGEKEQAMELMKTHLSRYKTDEAAMRQEYPAYFK